MGRIRLPLIVRDSDRQSSMMANFLIIDCLSAYNVIMGKPVMNDLNMVTSTRALAIKFLTPNGTRCIRGEQYSTRHCYEEAIKMGHKGRKVNVYLRREAIRH